MGIYDRTIKLIGQQNVDKLRNATVAVFGLGGVGGYAIEALARAGVGKLVLIDDDTVNDTNINRQLIATTNTIDMLKTEACRKRISTINSDTTVIALPVRIEQSTINQFDWQSYDYIVDAIDTITSKIILAKLAKQYNKKIIASMGTGNKLDATKLTISDISQTTYCPLARVMRKLYKDNDIKNVPVVYSTEKAISTNDGDTFTGKATPASISYVPAVAGLLLAQYVITDIINN